MIEAILPAPVIAVDTRRDSIDTVLFRAEDDSLGRVAEQRRREFATSRACAHLALTQLGLAPSAVPIGQHCEPRWPSGVVGSITHCSGYRGCAVAHLANTMTIGIDAEPHAALPMGVLNYIVESQERSWLSEHMRYMPEVHWDRLVFSAKESVYKAWFPLTGRSLGFKKVVLTLDSSTETFVARLLIHGPLFGDRRLTGFSGRWFIGGGLVLTAITATDLASS